MNDSILEGNNEIKTENTIPKPYIDLILELEDYLNGIIIEMNGQSIQLNVKDEIVLIQKLWHEKGNKYRYLAAKLTDLYSTIHEDLIPEIIEFSRSKIHPLVINSPMYYRSFFKPQGYAGDYLTLEWIYNENPPGKNLAEKCLSYFGNSFPIPSAVYLRKNLMKKRLSKFLDENKKESIKILSLASGPIRELREIIENEEHQMNIEFVLFDQDKEALDFAVQEMKKILENKKLNNITINPIHSSITDLIRPNPGRDELRKKLMNSDFIYCAGLTDYLKDMFFIKLLKEMYNLASDDGILFIGNLVESKESTWLMECILDWNLIYRTKEDFYNLALKSNIKDDSIKILGNESENVIFLEIKKIGI